MKIPREFKLLRSAFVVAIIFLYLSSCEAIIKIPLGVDEDNPLEEKKELIRIGKSTRLDVYSILGMPCWANDQGDVEVFGAWGSRQEWYLDGPLIPILPFPNSEYWCSFYLVIKYDDHDRVTSISDISESELGENVECVIPENE